MTVIVHPEPHWRERALHVADRIAELCGVHLPAPARSIIASELQAAANSSVSARVLDILAELQKKADRMECDGK